MKIKSNTWALYLGLVLCGGLLFASSPVVYAATNFKVGWDPNNEADLDGYGIYVREGSPGRLTNTLAMSSWMNFPTLIIHRLN